MHKNVIFKNDFLNIYLSRQQLPCKLIMNMEFDCLKIGVLSDVLKSEFPCFILITCFLYMKIK